VKLVRRSAVCFVSPVLIGAGWLDPFGRNAGLDPVYGELGAAGDGGGDQWHPAVAVYQYQGEASPTRKKWPS